MTRFGFELEVRSGARSSLAQLRSLGLTSHSHFHHYHCTCNECGQRGLDSAGSLFRVQQDCTADGEFISGILEYGSADADRAFDGLSRALILGGAVVTGNVGNHVHVEQSGMDTPAKRRLTRLFLRYQTDLQEIAAAGHDRVRSYNSPMSGNPGIWTCGDTPPVNRYRDSVSLPYHWSSGSYLCWKDQTVEFRLWNSTRLAWRLRTHVGLSVGMVHAAIGGEDCTERDTRCVEDVIGPYLDSTTWGGLIRQRFSKGGLETIPEVAA